MYGCSRKSKLNDLAVVGKSSDVILSCEEVVESLVSLIL
jgi:hypothetical protein